MHTRVTSEKMAHLASRILHDPKAREEEKSLAASVLAQVDPAKHSSDKLVTLASKVMNHKEEYSTDAVSLAGSVLAQAK